MKSKRHIFVAAFLLTAAVFVWGCFYIPQAQFHWTVEIGGGAYGLCHIKAMIYFAFGGGRIYVPSPVAAATLALAVGASALFLLFLIRGCWTRIRKHD